jgi:DNA-binding NarL/FixJ family response regulator
MSPSIRVVLSASATLVDHISATLCEASDIECRACAWDVDSMLRLCRDFEPQLILLEKATRLQPTLALLQRLQSERYHFTVVIVAHEPDPLHARRLLGEGVRGYLLVSAIYDDLAPAIRLVASGKTVLSPLVAQALLNLGN